GWDWACITAVCSSGRRLAASHSRPDTASGRLLPSSFPKERRNQMPHTILIVDDEDAVRRAWEKALRYAGHRVLSASNAKRALELCDEHGIDAVVLDFIMPGVDGIQLLVQIRKRLPFVRSVIVSGKLDSNIKQSDLSAELKSAVEADVYL